MSKKKTRSHKWRGQTAAKRIVCAVRALNGKWHEVAPAWFNLARRYGRIIAKTQLRAVVADGFDVYPDAETGALRLRDIALQVSYPIPSSWAACERAFMEDYSGRSVSFPERQQAIDEECQFIDLAPLQIGVDFGEYFGALAENRRHGSLAAQAGG